MNFGFWFRLFAFVILFGIWFSPKISFGQGGYTLDFNGSTSYVEIPYDAALNPATFSLEAWVKVEGGAGNYRSVITSRSDAGQTKGYMIYAGSDNNWQFWTGDNGPGTWDVLNSGVSISDTWTHIACTYDGSTQRIYINGLLAASGAGSYSENASMPARIGTGHTEGSPDFYFNGKIDEVRIWSDVRSQAEIQANMHKELEGSESNLVAYYSMSDGSGTTLTDNSSNTHNGTLTNSPTWKTSGALAGPGMALDLDGSDDHVNLGDVLENLGTVTMEAWVYWRGSVESYSEIFTKDLINSFSITSANNLHINFGDGSSWNAGVNSAKTIPTGTWTHLAATRDGDGLVKLYINGVLDANTATLSATGQNSAFRSIGCKYISSNTAIVGPFSGIIDEVRLWSSARSEAEIRLYKDRTLAGDESNLVAYYRFDQQADAGNTTLYDLTSNGNNGTLTNMAPASDWVVATPFNTWIGSENSDGSNVENWSSGSAPASTEDVGIFAWSGSNAPASANLSARNCYVASGVNLSSSGNLTLSGNYYNAGTFTTTGNVTFSGTSAQTLGGSGTSTFGTLTLNNSTGLTLEQGVSVTGALGLTAGVLDLNSQTLSLGSAATVSGSPGNSNHVDASSGVLRKYYASTGSFAFPVGDGTTYSPLTLNFTAGSFASGYAQVGLTAAKHPNNASVTDYINRYWTVSSSGISSFSCEVSAQYANGDISGSESNLYGGKYSAGDWTWLGAVTTGSNLITGTVSSFSDFTGGEESAFPVEWLHFGAKAEADLVRLDWTTARELNSDFFEVERSADQQNWNTLAQISAAGYSSTAQNYRYDDTQPLDGKTYYRLRQVDLDGSFDFSNVVEISRHAGLVSIYPNPVKDKLTIETQGQTPVTARLFDMQGRVVMQHNLDSGTQTLLLHDLPSDIYLIRLSNEKGWTQEIKVVKE